MWYGVVWLCCMIVDTPDTPSPPPIQDSTSPTDITQIREPPLPPIPELQPHPHPQPLRRLRLGLRGGALPVAVVDRTETDNKPNSIAVAAAPIQTRAVKAAKPQPKPTASVRDVWPDRSAAAVRPSATAAASLPQATSTKPTAATRRAASTAAATTVPTASTANRPSNVIVIDDDDFDEPSPPHARKMSAAATAAVAAAATASTQPLSPLSPDEPTTPEVVARPVRPWRGPKPVVVSRARSIESPPSALEPAPAPPPPVPAPIPLRTGRIRRTLSGTARLADEARRAFTRHDSFIAPEDGDESDHGSGNDGSGSGGDSPLDRVRAGSESPPVAHVSSRRRPPTPPRRSAAAAAASAIATGARPRGGGGGAVRRNRYGGGGGAGGSGGGGGGGASVNLSEDERLARKLMEEEKAALAASGADDAASLALVQNLHNEEMKLAAAASAAAAAAAVEVASRMSGGRRPPASRRGGGHSTPRDRLRMILGEPARIPPMLSGFPSSAGGGPVFVAPTLADLAARVRIGVPRRQTAIAAEPLIRAELAAGLAAGGGGGGGGGGSNPLLLALSMANRDFTGNDYELLSRLDAGANKGLSTTAINRFPTSTIPKRSNSTAAYESCVICLDDMEAGQVVRRLPCMHAFHAKCIDSWLEKSNTCPVDKQVMTP